ncbi:MAG: homoserine kinase, partial [Wenzhouxiangella sp.]|nr:homoserine kinase [Wenzhouxiangella sp.]
MRASQTTAFAPASVGNVGVGFDLLGHAIEGPGDTVTARRSEQAGVRISAIEGVVRGLPLDSERNTAGRAVMALLEARQPGFGVELVINKGIPLSSGLGGSAASAVAALVASNALLDEPLEHEALYPFALAGEAIASGAVHGDNVGPQLLGGLVLATADRLISIPVPEGLLAVVVHPDCQVETRRARESLARPFDINTIVAQSSHLAQFLAGCYSNDLDLVAAGLADVLVEPRRAHLIPGFEAGKQAALAHGALGAAISGAGPSVFSWFTQSVSAHSAASAMQAAFAAVNLDSQAWITPVQAPGA